MRASPAGHGVLAAVGRASGPARAVTRGEMNDDLSPNMNVERNKEDS